MTHPEISLDDRTDPARSDFDDLEVEVLFGPEARLQSDLQRPSDRALARAVVERFQRRSVIRTASLVAGGFAAAAALALAYVQLGRPSLQSVTGAPLAKTLTLEVSEGDSIYVEGTPVLGRREIAIGTKLSTQDFPACVRIEPSIRVCLGKASELELTAASSRQTLRVVRGVAVAELAALPAGRSFALGTKHGEAFVVGTLFAVELLNEAQTAVRVGRGRVAVRNGTRAELEQVEAGHSVVIGQHFSKGPADAAALARDRALLDGASSSSRLAEESADVSPRPDAPPARAAAQSTPTGAAHTQAGSPPEPAQQPQAEPDAKSLLEQARLLRGERRYAESALAYRRLLQRYPASAEARVALVSLGQLQLSHLDDAVGALGSFDKYLAGPGQLRQEAQFGRIQALARLGRSDAERKAIQAFLKSHPRSAQAAGLERRLGQLH